VTKVLICIVIFMVCLSPVLSLSQETDIEQRKDPILAGALSWYVPGLGQFYAGALFKGAAFLVAENVLLFSALLTVAELELGVSGDINLGLKLSTKQGGTSSSEKTTAIVLGTALVVVHFVNIIDAVNTTRNYNKALEKTVSPELQYDPETQAYSLGLSGRF
jgi:hypothetical protein